MKANTGSVKNTDICKYLGTKVYKISKLRAEKNKKLDETIFIFDLLATRGRSARNDRRRNKKKR